MSARCARLHPSLTLAHLGRSRRSWSPPGLGRPATADRATSVFSPVKWGAGCGCCGSSLPGTSAQGRCWVSLGAPTPGRACAQVRVQGWGRRSWLVRWSGVRMQSLDGHRQPVTPKRLTPCFPCPRCCTAQTERLETKTRAPFSSGREREEGTDFTKAQLTASQRELPSRPRSSHGH